MILRDIDFGPALVSAGTRGFFGEGYWFHRPWSRLFGLDFSGTTFISKTTTLLPRLGNLPLKADQITLKGLRPECIRVYFLKGVVLNAVGLSGPGFEWLLAQDRWQWRQEPFFISFMSVGASAKERLAELKKFVKLLQDALPGFVAKVGLEINFSCPNVGLHPARLFNEVKGCLTVAADLNIPVVPNFNPLIPAEVAKEISDHPICDAISVANAIPWGQLPEQIDWKRLFGSETSPLARFGGGGLSGRPLLPIVVNWVRQARSIGLTKPIVAGGGVLSVKAVDELKAAGASAVKIATIAILRPWRVNKVIERIQQLFS